MNHDCNNGSQTGTKRGQGSPDISDAAFRRAADSSIDGIAIVDIGRHILYVNESRARMHGYSPEELIGKDVAILSVPGAASAVAEEVLRTGRWQGEIIGIRKDGSTFPTRQTISRIDDPDGRPSAMLSVTRDVTSEHEAAENLRRSNEIISRNEQLFRLMVEGSPDFFFYIHDANGVFTYVSPSITALTGWGEREWAQHYTKFLADTPCNREAIRITEHTLKTGEVAPPYRVEVLHRDGHLVTLEVCERPIVEDGKVVGIRGIARDVTRLIEAEEHKRRFYRDTILSVTDGKLIICEQAEVDSLCSCSAPTLGPIALREPQDVALARDRTRVAAHAAGMEPALVEDLLLCTGEAATNALKHAGGGTLSMCDEGDVVRIRVSDQGPGMDSLALPKLTLLKGFSTTKSLGMGYATMLSLAGRIFLSTGSHGTTVIIEIPKHRQPETLDLDALPDLW